MSHATVMLHEAVEALQVKADGIYVDGTFGRGGHSRLILEKLGPGGRLIALDKDPAAVAAARGIQDQRFRIVHAGFSSLAETLDGLGVGKVDGVPTLPGRRPSSAAHRRFLCQYRCCQPPKLLS